MYYINKAQQMQSVKSIIKKKAEKPEKMKKIWKKIKINLLFSNIMINYMHIFNLCGCENAQSSARVAELADAYGWGPYGAILGGSTPPSSTKFQNILCLWFDKWGNKVYIMYRAENARWSIQAYIAQSVENVLGKDEVIGSSPIVGSIF